MKLDEKAKKTNHNRHLQIMSDLYAPEAVIIPHLLIIPAKFKDNAFYFVLFKKTSEENTSL